MSEAEPEPVPTARATIVAAQPFGSAEEADAWLERVRKDDDELAAEVDAGVRVLNRVLHAHRVAALDPSAREVSPTGALVIRVGYGEGEQVADGRFSQAYELPCEARGSVRRGAARRRAALAPQQRLAAILGGRDSPLAGEELLLRARADLEAGRLREASLQARVALEALIAELGREGRDVEDLRVRREAVGAAANTALDGAPGDESAREVAEAVAAMERALRHRAAAG